MTTATIKTAIRTRKALICQRCQRLILPRQRRATVKGAPICWPCAEPFAEPLR